MLSISNVLEISTKFFLKLVVCGAGATCEHQMRNRFDCLHSVANSFNTLVLN